jgi:hypothetical protein
MEVEMKHIKARTEKYLDATDASAVNLFSRGIFREVVMLVRQSSLDSFIEFASNEEYLAGLGHRSASVEDSRLLSLVEYQNKKIARQSRMTR